MFKRCVAYLVVCVLFVGLARSASAAFLNFVDTLGDGLWVAENWEDFSAIEEPFFRLPRYELFEDAHVLAEKEAIIQDGIAAEAGSLRVGGGGSEPGILTMTGGTLDIFDIGIVGSDDPASVGEFALSGGAVDLVNWIAAGFNGDGTIEMSGGTLSSAAVHIGFNGAGPVNTAEGSFTMTGGSLTTGSTTIGANAGGTGSLVVSGGAFDTGVLSPGDGVASITVSDTGQIILDGDVTADVQTWINSSILNSEVQFDFDVTNAGKTTISASVSIPGDFDMDGDVDGNDFLAWQSNPAVGSLSDWQNNYGMPLAVAAASVPESNSLVLLFTGIVITRNRNFLRF